jgi:FkbM family methyltransferase
MNAAEPARAITALLTRHLPRFLGLRRHWRRLNRAFLRLGAPPEATVRMKDGTRLLLDLRTTTQVDAFYTARYDPALVGAALLLYDPDSVFLDVGANIGFYAVAMAALIRRVHGAGRVVCVEPLPANADRLAQNLAGNQLEELCTICRVGLSDRTQTLLLTLREDFESGSDTGNASVAIGPDYDAGFRQVPVSLTTLDELWPSLAGERSRIDFVKLDIEGHEDRFFLGAQQTLAAQRPIVLMEVNKAYYDAKKVDMDEAILGHLPAGYRIFRRDNKQWRRVAAFRDCPPREDVLLIPVERLKTPACRGLIVDGRDAG